MKFTEKNSIDFKRETNLNETNKNKKLKKAGNSLNEILKFFLTFVFLHIFSSYKILFL